MLICWSLFISFDLEDNSARRVWGLREPQFILNSVGNTTITPPWQPSWDMFPRFIGEKCVETSCNYELYGKCNVQIYFLQQFDRSLLDRPERSRSRNVGHGGLQASLSINYTNFHTKMNFRSPYEHMVGKPNVKYVANMHGNEAVGREMMLHLILHLVQNYDNDYYVRWENEWKYSFEQLNDKELFI